MFTNHHLFPTPYYKIHTSHLYTSVPPNLHIPYNNTNHNQIDKQDGGGGILLDEYAFLYKIPQFLNPRFNVKPSLQITSVCPSIQRWPLTQRGRRIDCIPPCHEQTVSAQSWVSGSAGKSLLGGRAHPIRIKVKKINFILCPSASIHG